MIAASLAREVAHPDAVLRCKHSRILMLQWSFFALEMRMRLELCNSDPIVLEIHVTHFVPVK
jgi:hypothetical protein